MLKASIKELKERLDTKPCSRKSPSHGGHNVSSNTANKACFYFIVMVIRFRSFKVVFHENDHSIVASLD